MNLECDKGEKVVKTNVWVKIKRKGKYLQSVEDNFKEKNKGNVVSSNKDRERNRLQTKSGLRPTLRYKSSLYTKGQLPD